MAERKAEEERLAMEKALRERRWRAAGHIQRFWQGYKVRKVNLIQFHRFLLFVFIQGLKARKKKKAKSGKKGGKTKK